MSSLIWSEYMEEMSEQVIMDLFSVSHELAKEAIYKAGNNLKDIKRYIDKQVKRSKIKSYGRCRLCGRKLTDPISISRGYGDECYGKVGGKKYIDLLGD